MGLCGEFRCTKFEYQILEAFHSILPQEWIKTEQWKTLVIPPSTRVRSVYLHVRLSRGAFVTEAEGKQHYLKEDSAFFNPGNVLAQLHCDFVTEDYCLSKGISVFRIPYTFWDKQRKIAWMVEYVKNTAL